jgi:hypothetical protein
LSRGRFVVKETGEELFYDSGGNLCVNELKKLGDVRRTREVSNKGRMFLKFVPNIDEIFFAKIQERPWPQSLGIYPIEYIKIVLAVGIEMSGQGAKKAQGP